MCKNLQDEVLKEGIWRGEITLSEKKILPFHFDIVFSDSDTLAFLINARERIKIDELRLFGDSVKIPMHIFDAALSGEIINGSIHGFFIKYYEKDFSLPFKAEFGIEDRFPGVKQDPSAFVGEWAVTFTDPGDTIFAIGYFKADKEIVTGTFRLATGDYRYLEGVVIDDTLKMSTFDGNHAYLFEAVLSNDSILYGDFWSGKSYHASWKAVKDSMAQLPSADSLTFLRDDQKIDFSFPDLDSNFVSPDDFAGKVLILQIFGSWCPNCMDETKFLADWHKNNRDKPVEIVGLAYEMKDDFHYARSRVLRMKEKLGAEYEFLIAGTNDKEEASKTLPMLNEIISFPTLIFVARNGNVRKIHTGFSGPGTGVFYEQFKQDFEETVKELLQEPE